MGENVGMTNNEKFKIFATIFRQYNLAQRQKLIDVEAINSHYYNGTACYDGTYGGSTSYTWSTTSYSYTIPI